jgi:hypothetical protein
MDRVISVIRDLVALVIVLGIAIGVAGIGAYLGSGLAFQETEAVAVVPTSR